MSNHPKTTDLDIARMEFEEAGIRWYYQWIEYAREEWLRDKIIFRYMEAGIEEWLVWRFNNYEVYRPDYCGPYLEFALNRLRVRDPSRKLDQTAAIANDILNP